MSATLKLRIVTPTGPVVDLNASAITACSEVGEFCVLPEHRPILASLKPGRLMFVVDGEEKVYATDVGFFEGGADHANVMTQHCVDKGSLVIDELERILESSAQELSRLAEDSLERRTLESSISWIEAQLAVARD